MEVTVREGLTDPRVRIVEVSGEMDIGPNGVERFRQILDDLVDGGERRVVLDLSEATYIISRGFGQMLVALTRLRSQKGDLRVAGAKGAVWSAATTVGLDNIIKFYPSCEEALNSFAEEAAYL
ncbi:MAG: STAS domain-containing protein [Candidatus Zipacnadales bacterium]